MEICLPLVSEADSTSEAALLLNANVWSKLGVQYQPNLSPAYTSPQSVMQHGSASCTGLSVLLVACCRAVGVPARCCGVADWGDGSGNHVWVEIWDREGWQHIGAAEPSEFNATWFEDRLWPSDGPRVIASTFAPSSASAKLRFPLPWQRADESEAAVPGLDVTSAYRRVSD